MITNCRKIIVAKNIQNNNPNKLNKLKRYSFIYLFWLLGKHTNNIDTHVPKLPTQNAGCFFFFNAGFNGFII